MAARKLLGQILKELGLVHEGQIQEGLAHQREKGGRIGEVLIQLGHLDEADLSRALAEQAGNNRAANFVMLGAYVGATDVVPVEAVENAISKEFTGGKAKFIPGNIAAFQAGVAEGAKAKVGS